MYFEVLTYKNTAAATMVSSKVFHLTSSMASFAAVCSVFHLPEPSISLIPLFYNLVQLLRHSENDFPKVQLRCSIMTVFMFLKFFTNFSN